MGEPVMRDGTNQDDRVNPALEPGYIHVDEMRLEDFLAMSSDYARLITFFNLKNEAHGDWEAFFASDEAVIFSMILTTDLNWIESDFFVFMREMAWGMGAGMGRNLYLFDEEDWRIVPNYRLALMIDRWFTSLKTAVSVSGERLNQKIAFEIESKLREALYRLKMFLEQYSENVTELFLRDFHRDWFDVRHIVSVPTATDEKAVIEQFLKSNFYTFFNTLMLLKDAARKALPLSLKSKTHLPSTGLYIAFAQLLRRAQEKLNLFPQRHLNFYYHEILKVQPRKRVSDAAYLVFHPTLEDREIWIKKGTEFVAGTDQDKHDVIYTAENDLMVSHAEIVSLKTLYFARNALSSPENSMDFTSAAKTNMIPILESLTLMPGVSPQFWPVFGAPKTEAEQRRYEDAQFGFAVASPILLLKEGEREIALSIKMTVPIEGEDPQAASEKTFNEVLEEILLKMKTDAGDQNPLGEAEKQAFFFKVFRQIFQIALTTEKGWMPVDGYLPLSQVIEKSLAKDQLQIQISLPMDADAIVPYSPAVHGKGYETDSPIIRFKINPLSYLFPYSFLASFVVKEMTIDVSVKEARELVLYNQLGQLDPGSPCNPFGPLPTVGSYFIISNPEMARKHISQFEVDVEWGGLPLESGGFETHYRAYPLSMDNTVFKARITTLSGGRWQPIEEEAQKEIDLFTTKVSEGPDEGGARINKNRRLSCESAVSFFKPVTGRMAEEDLAYGPDTKGGFFKFTLTEPDIAFGHLSYPLLLTDVLTTNARLKHAKLFKPVPNAPYTPLINALSINYKACTTINLAQTAVSGKPESHEKIFHLHPFGFEVLSPETYRSIPLLPSYRSAGYLFIGLSAKTLPRTLTLFFHMREDSTPETGTAPSEFNWSYLVSNRWVRLEKSQVVSDTTSGFLTSGIVTLNIPEVLYPHNTVMPGECYWLAVSVDARPETLCSVYAIHTQALKVRWQFKAGQAAHLDEPLPAGTIKSSQKSIPGIGAIDQVLDSFGGRPAEKTSHIKKRISERLKHKNRASTVWDYERLILEEFPAIFKVKCFDNMVSDPDPEKRTRPGHILIVVIPRQTETLSANAHPMVNGAVLKEVCAFVKALASPFVNIAVRNPVYEQIQVRCTVKFKKQARAGYDVDRLNHDISCYLSPWHEMGYRAGFGWCVRRYEMETFIRNLDYVDFVSNFSMLHITDHGQGSYHLFDTAEDQTRDEKIEAIHPMFPWSLPVPIKRHFIETMDQFKTIQPEITGVDELEIGSTFIIYSKK